MQGTADKFVAAGPYFVSVVTGNAAEITVGIWVIPIVVSISYKDAVGFCLADKAKFVVLGISEGDVNVGQLTEESLVGYGCEIRTAPCHLVYQTMVAYRVTEAAHF